MITKVKAFYHDALAIIKYDLFRMQKYPKHLHPLVPKKLLQNDWSAGIHLHAYHFNVFREMLPYIKNIPIPFTLYVTVTQDRTESIQQILRDFNLEQHSQVLPCENKGRDIGPWLKILSSHQSNHQIWCHVHTKRSPHLSYRGHIWRRYLLKHLLGSPNHISKLLGVFERDTQIGLIFPPPFSFVYNQENLAWGQPLSHVKRYIGAMIKAIPPEPGLFPMGTMLWYRPDALIDLFQHFASENSHTETSGDNQWETIERALPLIAKTRGYTSVMVIHPNKVP